MAGKTNHRSFGSVDPRRNARTRKVTGYRARYPGPDGATHSRTFGDKPAAEAWLAEERKLARREAPVGCVSGPT